MCILTFWDSRHLGHFRRQRLLMGVETKVDYVLHAEITDFCELCLGRLTRGRYPTVQTIPAVNAFGVGHWKHLT